MIPADGSAARRIGHGEFGRILELAVAPDGRTAAVACADGRLLTVALDTRREIHRPEGTDVQQAVEVRTEVSADDFRLPVAGG